MLAILPLFIAFAVRRREWSKPMLRTWAAMFAASALAWIVTPMAGDRLVMAYAAICAAGGLATIVRPACGSQYQIGALFLFMFAWNAGAYFNGHGVTGSGVALNAVAGWMQLGILLFWGLADVGKVIVRHFHRGRDGGNDGPLIRAAR